MSELTQKQKATLRWEQVLSEPGFHEIKVLVTPDKEVIFWIVKTEKVEGVVKNTNVDKT